MEEVWETMFEGKKYYGACGPRNVLIIRSSDSLEGPEIVPRKKGTLTAKDKERLTRQGIPEECWGDDTLLMEARYRRQEERFTVLPVECGDGLTSQGVLDRIRAVMKNTDKPGSKWHYRISIINNYNMFVYTVSVYYIGPGKKHTGDWCFADGFITFNDITRVYMECFRSKTLTVSSDCSYSGRWVRELTYFLDDVGVQPCGHSARKENILLSMYASCKSHQIPHTLLYSARGQVNEEESGQLYHKWSGYEVEQGQHTSHINSTVIKCKEGASFADPCLIANDFTWDKWRENQRIHLVTGEQNGKKAWYYVFLHDDEAMQEQFEAAIGGTINFADYGTVFKSGWGEDPPEKLRRAIERRGDRTKHTYY
jgi:hypothetical protein